ncbi:PIG-X-domain-containing protein [Plenodomus tracheiphilus IPT5]|uniref:Protein PBN1 n=1 Tax=Plenodomus tracheiphilus IPT5 TaxID=1408161 RepID=A0A6A7BJR4_9PLEO|nr:PIG-X-domain-containing protein [Plenodomus tracheiphilus IPT5]
MKQRITYVVDKPDEFSPDQLSVKNEGSSGPRFALKGVNAAKEHRITLGLKELPEELSEVFQQWHELHVRWASSTSHIATPPFTSRVSPGLHIFFTPLDSTPENALCTHLHSIVSAHLKCSSTNDSSIKLPILSERFSMSTTSQYYAFLDTIDSLAGNIASKFCQTNENYCRELAKELLTATSLDIDYDTISRAVVLTATWPTAPNNEGWSEDIALPHKEATVEIGVLSHEPNADPEDIQFGGFLTVLGQDSAPTTRFQTPTRHYPLLDTTSPSLTPQLHPLIYTTSLSHPTGLHPTLILSFPHQHLTPPNPSCKLHTHLTLPSYLFIDKYQFNDPLFLSSKNLVSLRSLAGATDLEAPDWVVNTWGSAALSQLAHPKAKSPTTQAQDGNAKWNISIPLHLRYLPANPTTHTRVPVPWPVVFWACRADEGAKMSANPFDRVHLGYEALFGPKTRFMHVQPAPGLNVTGADAGLGMEKGLVEWIDVPVLDTRRTGWVEGGTVGLVLVAFLGLCWVLFGRGGGRRVDGGKKKQ